jgi:hypothetical protein
VRRYLIASGAMVLSAKGCLRIPPDSFSTPQSGIRLASIAPLLRETATTQGHLAKPVASALDKADPLLLRRAGLLNVWADATPAPSAQTSPWPGSAPC